MEIFPHLEVKMKKLKLLAILARVNQECIALLSTDKAASFTASEKVG